MNSSRLRETSTLKLDTPVRLPPGRDRLSTTPERDRVAPHLEDNRDRRGRRFRRERYGSAAGRDNDGDLTTGQICRERGQSIVLAFRPSILDRDVATLDISAFGKTFVEGLEATGKGPGELRAKIPYDRHCR